MTYEEKIVKELHHWQQQMQRDPSWLHKKTRRLQTKINNIIPEKAHQAITATIKQMVRGVLFGAQHTTAPPIVDATLAVRETLVQEKIIFYRKTGAIEGGITGAGGILLGLADFPLLLALKIKLLFDIAAMYGYSTNNYKERVYLLYIFQLAFSGQEHRKKIYSKMQHWEEQSNRLPDTPDAFDWRSFQQEYRDYLDLAKMAQLIPIVGAPIGAVVNYRLIKKLGETAMNAYRLRWFEK